MSRPIEMCYHTVYMDGMKCETKASVWMVDVPAEIQTWHLLNISLSTYNHLLSYSCGRIPSSLRTKSDRINKLNRDVTSYMKFESLLVSFHRELKRSNNREVKPLISVNFACKFSNSVPNEPVSKFDPIT